MSFKFFLDMLGEIGDLIAFAHLHGEADGARALPFPFARRARNSNSGSARDSGIRCEYRRDRGDRLARRIRSSRR